MLDLLDYRRTTHEMYRRVRELGNHTEDAYDLFRLTRDRLFRSHSQSPLTEAERSDFMQLPYYRYDSAYRVIAPLLPVDDPQTYTVELGEDGTLRMRQIGTVEFSLPTGDGTLGVFWIEGYGGGVFIPFRDETNGETTYGGGRYLYDTIKGADLGMTPDGEMVLDFNYAYHPSCAYNPRWVCPLAPTTNQLRMPVPAGEKLRSK